MYPWLFTWWALSSAWSRVLNSLCIFTDMALMLRFSSKIWQTRIATPSWSVMERTTSCSMMTSKVVVFYSNSFQFRPTIYCSPSQSQFRKVFCHSYVSFHLMQSILLQFWVLLAVKLLAHQQYKGDVVQATEKHDCSMLWNAFVAALLHFYSSHSFVNCFAYRFLFFSSPFFECKKKHQVCYLGLCLGCPSPKQLRVWSLIAHGRSSLCSVFICSLI